MPFYLRVDIYRADQQGLPLALSCIRATGSACLYTLSVSDDELKALLLGALSHRD